MSEDPHQRLRAALEHASHLLPAQGPIGVFVHHNTLHAFEHLPFDEAVVSASGIFGTQPWLSEGRYRQCLREGRILPEDVEAVLRAEEGEEDPLLAGGRLRRLALRRLLLRHTLRRETGASLRWTLTEGELLQRYHPDVPEVERARQISTTRNWVARRIAAEDPPGRAHAPLSAFSAEERPIWEVTRIPLRPDNLLTLMEEEPEPLAVRSLWVVCTDRVATFPRSSPQVEPPHRHRDLLLPLSGGVDPDELVHPLLIRLCASFLDQGLSYWEMPDRERGFWASFRALYGRGGGPPDSWLGGLVRELARLGERTGEQIVLTMLEDLGVPDEEWEAYVSASLVALRGWAGMFRQLELRPDRAPVAAPPATLMDFLAVRLVLDRLAVLWVARHQVGFEGSLFDLRAWCAQRQPVVAPSILSRSFLLFQVAQLAGLTAGDVEALSAAELEGLLRAIEAFGELDRRRLLHLAYERRHRIGVLDALAGHHPPSRTPPALQVICCLDERNESLRRYLEEGSPDIETFGTLGFFGVAMYYQAVDDRRPLPLCPIVLKPQHVVEEVVVEEHQRSQARRELVRRQLGRLSATYTVGSRTLVRGGLLSVVLGIFAAIPLVARVLFPRLTARTTTLTQRRLPTRLALERTEDTPLEDGRLLGFSVEEMAQIVDKVLRELGLLRHFAPLVAIVGHGSGSLNNPHESAYDCGACGGGKGGPNARAFAMMANDPRVRMILRGSGFDFSDETQFIGAFHNTCNDSVTWYDEDLLPESHLGHLERLKLSFQEACRREAQERCRRFASAPLDLSPAAALRHVEERAEDLAQPRPELGHATNAVAILGRRWRTRGLFLDRRAFLASYDPEQDATGEVLSRLLAAVTPVGAGINLEYFFSHVDPTGYGCGSKLPHNLVGYLGIMDGPQSDLRTGLPWQMVEIHEPVRLLVVIDAPRATILEVARRQPMVLRLVQNRWIQLVAWEGSALYLYQDGSFVRHHPESLPLPVAGSSADWYRGRREHLPAATIEPRGAP